MKYRTRMRSIGTRGVLLLAVLLAVVAGLTFLTNGEMKAQGGPPEILDAPKLTRSAREGNVIELRWDAAAGEVRYEFASWWDAGNGCRPIGGDNLGGTTYTHRDVAAETTNWYSISAVYEAEEKSGWLTEYPSTDASAPSVPELTARATEGGVELNWEAALGAVRYELATWWDTGIGWQYIGGDNLDGTTYMHRDVAAGTRYWYSIRAVSEAGEKSGWLMEYPFATPLAQSAPSMPALTARATVEGVELSWEAAAGAVRYELMTWWDLEIGWQAVGGDNLTSTTYTHTDVAAGTTYFYSIRALNAKGETSGWLLEYPYATALAADPATVAVRPMQATSGRGALMEL